MTVACMCISLVICRPKCVFVSIILVFVSLCFCVLEFVYVCCLCMYVRLSACLPAYVPTIQSTPACDENAHVYSEVPVYELRNRVDFAWV